MKNLIIALLLLASAPAFAAVQQPTAAQWKDFHKLSEAFDRCGGQTEDPEFKEDCALSIKLQRKLRAQGFCFYKRILMGRPGIAKDGLKECLPLHD